MESGARRDAVNVVAGTAGRLLHHLVEPRTEWRILAMQKGMRRDQNETDDGESFQQETLR